MCFFVFYYYTEEWYDKEGSTQQLHVTRHNTYILTLVNRVLPADNKWHNYYSVLLHCIFGGGGYVADFYKRLPVNSYCN